MPRRPAIAAQGVSLLEGGHQRVVGAGEVSDIVERLPGNRDHDGARLVSVAAEHHDARVLDIVLRPARPATAANAPS